MNEKITCKFKVRKLQGLFFYVNKLLVLNVGGITKVLNKKNWTCLKIEDCPFSKTC